jgi:hypothetical protein
MAAVKEKYADIQYAKMRKVASSFWKRRSVQAARWSLLGSIIRTRQLGKKACLVPEA